MQAHLEFPQTFQCLFPKLRQPKPVNIHQDAYHAEPLSLQRREIQGSCGASGAVRIHLLSIPTLYSPISCFSGGSVFGEFAHEMTLFVSGYGSIFKVVLRRPSVSFAMQLPKELRLLGFPRSSSLVNLSTVVEL